MGGFPTIRHNEIRDITTTLLTEVFSNVNTELTLPPLELTGGFWNALQYAFFDIKVFYPNASSNHSNDPLAAYREHEQAKKCEYGQRIGEIERLRPFNNRWHGP